MQSEKIGKVWLVGAGPSDAGLMTLRGYEALRNADVVVYDKLLGSGILSMIKSTAKKIYVGKSSFKHIASQDEINRILLCEAMTGAMVVRLKGGDPFLFGRGGEEIEQLIQQGIPFEVVPGVTSAVAVPAYAGIPVTHRDFSSSLHIFTGHSANKKDSSFDFSKIAGLEGTLVFLMGVNAAKKICGGLIEAGMSENTPAAAVENGTSARQRTVTATLGTLPDKISECCIKPPAVIVIGRTAALANRFSWIEQRPLNGKRVVVTRPYEKNREFCKKISCLGGEAVADPCIKTEYNEKSGLPSVIGRLCEFSWIVFQSSTGVDFFFEQLHKTGKDTRSLYNIKIAAIGEITAEKLSKRGIIPDLVPDKFDSGHLAQKLDSTVKNGEKVLIIKAAAGSSELENNFCRQGIVCETVEAYRTASSRTHPEFPETENIIKNNKFDCITFASPSAVRGFKDSFPELDFGLCTAVCIGNRTAAEAEKLGMRVLTAEKSTEDGMIEIIKKL